MARRSAVTSAPTWAGNQRPGVDVGLGEDSKAQFGRCGVDGRRFPLASEHFVLDDGLVRLFADGLHVDAEEDVSHGGVPDDHDLVDVPAVEAQFARHPPDLEIERRQHDLLKLAVKLAAVVRDAVHDVAAPEPLGVLKRCGVEHVARFEIDEVHNDGCRAHVYR